MKLRLALLGFMMGLTGLTAQVDSTAQRNFVHYLEDQVFFNVSYINIRHLYPGISQQGFSHAISFGFIRDIPVNLRRNLGFGLGFGYERDVYYQNLRISKEEQTGAITYQVLAPDDYINNAFVVKKLVFPIEFRYRNSTAERFRFFRIYTGMMLGYTVGAESHYETEKVALHYIKLSDIPNGWQYGLYLYAGYGELNGFVYYGLNDLFSPQVEIGGSHVPMYDLKFGVMLSFL